MSPQILRWALTCVGHHQPPPSTSKHRSRFLHVSAGRQSRLGSEEGFASSAEHRSYRSVIRSQAPRKCLGVGLDMILCPFCNPWRVNGRILLETNNLYISKRERQKHSAALSLFLLFLYSTENISNKNNIILRKTRILKTLPDFMWKAISLQSVSTMSPEL